MPRYSLAFLFLALLLVAAVATAQPTLRLRPLVRGLERPVEVTSPPNDKRLFIIEQPGRIRVVGADGKLRATPFLDIVDRVVSSGNEQGLLGLAFAPDYAKSGYFFVNYTGRGGDTYVTRFQRDPANPDKANVASELRIYFARQPFSNHNGGCMRFGPDGMLYVGLGDGGAGGDPGNRAQDLASPLGKLLRLDVRGATAQKPYAVPADNPFVKQKGALPEIWAYGLRNPWRFAFDRQNGDLWIADVGQNKWEEVDWVTARNAPGANYGWRCREGAHAFKPKDCGGRLVEPVFEYGHDERGGYSITGGFVYRGRAYPALAGYYVCADYVSGNVWLLRPGR
ncbi:MAG TPA: PQQ-dependent sugar dehydrogenase, partial [bacterium]|nr:PQQ-dependent sugar dehydrogenase [bacterium]